MSHDPFWLPVAKTVPAGRHIRISCCANDKSLMVHNEARGFRAYCFRCGPAGFVPHGDFSIEQLKRRREEMAWSQSKTIALPHDFSTDIPASEAVWLYKSGVSSNVAKHYGFGYSPSLRRVILPVYKAGKLVGYTARSTIGEKPKYLERADASAVFTSDPRIALPSAQHCDAYSKYDCVLTEDILSAVRVGRNVQHCCAAMGTSLDARQLATVTQQGVRNAPIALWLDPDKAGQKAVARIRRTLQLLGREVRVIRSDKDPKYYSNDEIRRYLLSD